MGKFITRVFLPDGFFHQNEINMTKYLLYLETSVDLQHHLVFPESVAEERIAREIGAHSFYNIFTRSLFSGMAKVAKRFAIGQSNLDLLRVAVALERYRLAHGEYPQTQDSLSPQFMAVVPHDIIGGQPLHYKREANGLFTLYSIGWNQTDDGGKVVFREDTKGMSYSPNSVNKSVDKDQGDWVWKYPELITN